MKARILFTVAIFASLLAKGDVIHINPTSIADLQVRIVAKNKCLSSTDPNLYELSIKFADDTSVTHQYCHGDGPKDWDQFFAQLKSFVAGPTAPSSCLLSEDCRGSGPSQHCERYFGMTVITDDTITLFTTGAVINDAIESVKTKCQ